MSIGAEGSWTPITTFRLLGAFAEASLLGVASGKRDRSRVFEGCLLLSSSTMPFPGVAALIFPDDAGETGSLGGVVVLETLNVVTMVSEMYGGETAPRWRSVGFNP